MDSLQPVLQPVLRIWRGLSRPQQIGLGAILAAVAGLLFVVSTVGRTSDMAVAFSNLNTDDQAVVVAKLKDAKIPYDLVDGGSIRVPSGQVNEAKLALAGAGLQGQPATGQGFELFNQNSFGQTEFTQKVNYQRALENELARSIGRMDAIESARVHLVIPQPTLFTSQQKEPTASVILKLKPGKRFDSAQVRSIANLVGGSVEGLKAQNLSIVDVNGNTLSSNDSGTNPAGLSGKQLDTQKSYETNVERDLQALLDRVLGAGKAAVRVSAAMNWDQVEQTNETFTPNDPTKTPIRTTHQITESTAPGGSAVGGVPGAAANNGAVPTYQGQTGGSSTTTTKSDTDTTYELNKSIQKVVTAPGAVKRLSVSVMLDDDPNNPNPALRQSVQDAITAAAGIDTTRGDLLTVTSLAFNRTALQIDEAAMAEAVQKEQYLSYARIGALVLGPLVMLVALWLILGRGKRKETKAEKAMAEAARAAEAAAQPVAEPAQPIMPAIPGRRQPGAVAQPIAEDPQKVYIREQILTLGKTNPATMAQLIQTWMDEDRKN